MSEANTIDVAAPFGLGDDTAGESEQAAAVESAKAELAEEQRLGQEDGPPPEVTPILEKYGNDPVKLAQAFRGLQQQISRFQQGQGPAPQDPLGQPQGQAQPPAGEQQQPPGEAPPQVQQQGEQLPEEKVIELQDALFEQAGNEAKYQAVRAWARNNIPGERIQAYDQALQSGDKEQALLHFKAMQYDFVTSQGYEGRLLGGRAPRSSGRVEGFRSQGEMETAMADPRYSPQSGKFDENYHRSVIERIAVSSF